jgi:hypothetical protein
MKNSVLATLERVIHGERHCSVRVHGPRDYDVLLPKIAEGASCFAASSVGLGQLASRDLELTFELLYSRVRAVGDRVGSLCVFPGRFSRRQFRPLSCFSFALGLGGRGGVGGRFGRLPTIRGALRHFRFGARLRGGQVGYEREPRGVGEARR